MVVVVARGITAEGALGPPLHAGGTPGLEVGDSGENAQVKERRRQDRHPSRACPELVTDRAAAGVFVGHHQALRPVRGTYFDAYVMIDIFRYIVGTHLQAHEPGLLVAGMMTEVFAVQGVPE